MLEFIKGIVRPVIIFWGLGMYTACLFGTTEMPILIQNLVGAVILEYVIERSVKRFKGK